MKGEYMTPEEALELLTNVTSHLQLNRPDHQQIITALQVVESLVHPVHVGEIDPADDGIKEDGSIAP